MSLIVRLILPLLIVAIVGLCGAMYIGWRTGEISQVRDDKVRISMETLNRPTSIEFALEDAKHELRSVTAMTALIDTGEVWDRFEKAVARAQRDVDWLKDTYADGGDMHALATSLDQSLEAWNNGAAIMMGQIPASRIPTMEQMRRYETQISDLSVAIGQQAQIEAIITSKDAAHQLKTAVSFATYLVAGLIAIFTLIAFIPVRQTSRRVQHVSEELRVLAGANRKAGEEETTRNELVAMMKALSVLQLALDEQRSRAEASIIFQSELTRVVDSACDGDFSGRIQMQTNDPDIERFGQRVNDLMEEIDRGVSQVSSILTAFAKGDLRQRMEGEFKGVFEDLQQNANSMAGKLHSLVRDIHGASSKMQHAMSTISGGASDLSQRTTEHAKALDSTSQEMRMITGSVESTAKSATEAQGLSRKTAEIATSSGSIAERAIDAMRRVEDSSRQISEITGVVEGISFQTNLLALNASVEAARAGEAGKGFAVVATEVRTLAQRSAEAANHIKALIEQSTSNVDESSRLFSETHDALSKILQETEKFVHSMDEITEACRNQSSGVQRVASSVSQIEGDTKNNAVLAENSALAASEVTEYLENLSTLVNFFELDAIQDQEQIQGSSAYPQHRTDAA